MLYHQNLINSCGAITAESSYLAKLFQETVDKTPDEIAEYLEHDDEVLYAPLRWRISNSLRG
jgi:non-ribosomal peptide synthetase component F